MDEKRPFSAACNSLFRIILTSVMLFFSTAGCSREGIADRNGRMTWWREARFGLFIHWGLYAIPAGEWGRRTDYGEWIMHSAQIPVEEYEKFVPRFNPVKFDADEWVRMAKEAGMRYIVITSKHHDGFCLFDSEETDYDIMSTPFHQDIMGELADACRRQGLRICWYHSIMDWHHPDYLPRRNWEERPAEGADYGRYIGHLKKQVKELLTRYGRIGVMWFDGEWEGTWTHEMGLDLYDYCRQIRPDVIVNNRVDKGRSGMAGLTVDARYAGDFGTPEQEIPPTGLPGVDWETCMTMNRHWGYNKADDDYKTPGDLIHKLVDISSKGGNFLLNVGPTAEGEFPPESIERLEEIGRWMRVNGESIYGTRASPFKALPWGRCTQKDLGRGRTRLFLHVFDWPEDGRLIVPGIYNKARKAFVLAGGAERNLMVVREEDSLIIDLPGIRPDPYASVIVLDVDGRPDINEPPAIEADFDRFIGSMDLRIVSERENVDVRYTLDGSVPAFDSPLAGDPVRISETTEIKARVFRNREPVSGVRSALFTKVDPLPSENPARVRRGLRYRYYEGDWDLLPDFDSIRPNKAGVLENFSFSPRNREEYFGFEYTGWIQIDRQGMYRFFTTSDDGSRLYIGDRLVVDNDGLHSASEKDGSLPLAAGYHRIRVCYFEKTGGDVLEVSYEGPGFEKTKIPEGVLFYTDGER